MSKTQDLSPTMRTAIHEIYSHGGVVERRPGGFWTWPQCLSSGGVPLQYYGTSTIEALVSRGRLAYSKRQAGRRGEFPIEATVTAQAAE